MKKNIILAAALLTAIAAFAEDGFLDRPAGIQYGHLTLRPYVSLSYTFDSNPDSSRSGDNNASYWTVNPGVDFDYKGENWKIYGLAYYQYHAFSSGNESQLNNSSYGEQLGFDWTNIEDRGPGWAFKAYERYMRVDQNDDFGDGEGKGLWRNRDQVEASVILQRRFNEFWHAGINGSYYRLKYDNDPASYGPLYGWDRWTAGLQLGCTLSQWTDFFIAGGYQSFNQESNIYGPNTVGSHSDGWTAHIGVGSYMTDKISYRVSGGVSTFNYGDESSDSGFTYQGNLKWKITDSLTTMLLFSSYYHPSEREYGSAVRCDSVSWGIAKSLISDKLNATFDIAYRRDTHVYSRSVASEWDLNLITARLGVNYRINRLFSVFARGEYQDEINDGDGIGNHYDYDRWRVTVGVKFTY